MNSAQDAVATARNYYNSDDADTFYSEVWGGEDIHIGLYETNDESIRAAARRTVERMAERVRPIGPGTRVLDIGAGYAGSMRYLAASFGCRCTALNLSEVENARARALNRAQGLDGLIEVVDGSFQQIERATASCDVVWSQDAILHSDDREQVFAEVARVLRPGGRFVMTDPMQADGCPPGVLDPILERIHLSSLGSPGFYLRAARDAGLADEGYEDQTPQLARHYARVRAELQRRRRELAGEVSDDYIERMLKGLQHWVDGGRNGHLAWGIFLFRKPG